MVTKHDIVRCMSLPLFNPPPFDKLFALLLDAGSAFDVAMYTDMSAGNGPYTNFLLTN